MNFPETLITKAPEAGFELALKILRLNIKAIQPDEDIRNELTPVHEKYTDSLIATAHMVDGCG